MELSRNPEIGALIGSYTGEEAVAKNIHELACLAVALQPLHLSSSLKFKGRWVVSTLCTP
jgi:hypothetical protein